MVVTTSQGATSPGVLTNNAHSYNDGPASGTIWGWVSCPKTLLQVDRVTIEAGIEAGTWGNAKTTILQQMQNEVVEELLLQKVSLRGVVFNNNNSRYNFTHKKMQRMCLHIPVNDVSWEQHTTNEVRKKWFELESDTEKIFQNSYDRWMNWAGPAHHSLLAGLHPMIPGLILPHVWSWRPSWTLSPRLLKPWHGSPRHFRQSQTHFNLILFKK